MGPYTIGSVFEALGSDSRRVFNRSVRGSREISLAPSLYRESTDSLIGMGMVPRIIDVWGYDREFCSSSPSFFSSFFRLNSVTQKRNNIIVINFCKNVTRRDWSYLGEVFNIQNYSNMLVRHASFVNSITAHDNSGQMCGLLKLTHMEET